MNHYVDGSHASIEDEQRFTLFVAQIGPQALRVALRWTRSRDAAQDVVQEAFVRTWQSRMRIKDSPRAWFFKVLWNVFLNFEKRKGSHPEIDLDEHAMSLNTDGHYQQVDDQDEVAELLMTLSEVDRHLLAMRYGEDFTLKEISRITGMPIGTVKSRIHRALKDIRKSLPSDNLRGTSSEMGIRTEK